MGQPSVRSALIWIPPLSRGVGLGGFRGPSQLHDSLILCNFYTFLYWENAAFFPFLDRDVHLLQGQMLGTRVWASPSWGGMFNLWMSCFLKGGLDDPLGSLPAL